MAMGKRKRRDQGEFWIATAALPRGAAHPLNARINEILDQHDFDSLVGGACRRFYAERMGRPSQAPAVYFRLLLIGYFEGIDSERGIAWRVGDSLGLRRTHLRGHESLLKRLLVHLAGFNLSLIVRRVIGVGTPRGLQGLSRRVFLPDQGPGARRSQPLRIACG